MPDESEKVQGASETPPPSLMREIGVTGLDWTSGMVMADPEPDLHGTKGVEQYDLMRHDDPTVRAVIMALELPIREARWRVNPASDAAIDVEAAEFVESTMNDMSTSWDDMISEACTMFPFGWAFMEWTLKRRLGLRPPSNLAVSQYDDGRVSFRKVALRAQMSLWDWDFDDSGNVQGMVQDVPYSAEPPRKIPLAKAFLFRTTRERNNPEGLSVLRPTWRSWKFKRNIERIEAIGLQRALMGLPVIRFEGGYTTEAQAGMDSDEYKALQILKGLYDNRMMGMIEQPNMQFRFEVPDMKGLTGDSGRVIQRYDEAIARAVLAQYIMLGSRERGSYALAKELGDLFFMAVEGFTGSIAQVFSRWGVPILFKYNAFPGISGYPEITTALNRRVDLETLADFINKVVGQQVIIPDEALEQYVRQLADFPPKAITLTPEGEPVTPATEEDVEEPAAPPDIEEGELSARSGERFAVSGDRLAAYHSATNAYQEELRRAYEGWIETVMTELGQVGPDESRSEIRERWKELAAIGLLLFKRRGYERLPEAMALGYGSRALPPYLRSELERESVLNDQYLEDNLWPAVAKELDADSLYQALMLKWAGNDAAFDDIVRGSLTRRRGNAQQYSGQFWRVIMVGAVARLREEEDAHLVPVAWVLDEMARHCSTCLLFGDRDYANIEDLLQFTGGILPGNGTECDGWCRCHLIYMRNGSWTVL